MYLVSLLLSTILVAVPLAAQAAARPLSPIKLHHTSWTAKDGAPPSIIAIAQTPDRWLWLASSNGVYRFDGVRFERFQPPGEQKPGNDIWGMRVLGNGALWIGYRSGGASLWQQGRLRNFGAADGFPVASVVDFEQDWRGRVWASTSQGLRMFDGSRWTAPQMQSTGQCMLLADPAKTVWARCESGTFVLPKGAEAFAPSSDGLGFGRMAMSGDGTVWAMGGQPGELAALSGPGRAKPAPPWPRAREAGGTMLFERDGLHGWATRADGVLRFGPGEQATVFGAVHGLSGSLPNAVFQDAEGNVWVGTENGLDRFRPAALQGVALPQIRWDTPAIAAGENGALWVGGTQVRTPGYEAFAALPAEDPASAVSAIHRHGADVWTGGLDGLWHYRDGKRQAIPLPDYVTTRQFNAIMRDSEGALWTAIRGAGLLRWKDGAWQRGGGIRELERRPDSMLADSHGRLWFGYTDNTLSVLEGGKVSVYGAEQGMRIGAVLQIAESAKGIWLSGLNGLYHFDGRQFVQVLGQGDDPMLGVSGMVDDGDALWLNGAAGITVVSKAELERALGTPGYRVNFRRLDHKDGLRGVATNSFPVPSAVAGTDGKLWFATTAGLFWLDRKAGADNRLAPPVYIRSANVDGADIPLAAQGVSQLPSNPGRVQIDFTSLSFTMPERMQFQYQLEGVDRGWQQGGALRTATYTDLGPGNYTFRVRAANNDGVWSERDAVAAFHVEPAFYQTAWFRELCAVAVALGLWGLYKLRVAQIARQVEGRVEARLQERERIARDLHDTLLQTVQALLLQMQCAWHKLPPGEPVRRDIERSLDLAQAALEEGRDKVQGLRAPQGGDLLTEVSRALKAEHPDVELELRASGELHPLAPAVYDELRAIALEALRNAVRHAGASQIIFEVCYAAEALSLTVRDNGRGLPVEVQQVGRAEGHWGLVGMRERAQRLGAQLIVDSVVGVGTILTVQVPGQRAYLAV
ncbi:MAG TPA: triple tyrosine motif-containing protein [Pseudoduganella sp.]